MEQVSADALKAAIQKLLHGYSIETTPKAARSIGDFSAWLKPATRVYVTFLPGSTLDDTLLTCQLLKEQGMQPVPHIAVRNLESEAQLRYALEYLAVREIHQILLLAGAVRQAKGPYHCVQRVLQSGLIEEYALKGVGFAGHPEGSPDISDEDIRYAESMKQNYATMYPRDYWLVSQFCFDAAPVIAWQRQLRSRNIEFPLRIGITGLATFATLIRHAHACGVGSSMAYLFKHSRGVRQLMKTSTPDQVIRGLAAEVDAFSGLHFFPLGSFERTVSWLQAVEAGRFVLTGEGFRVT